MTKRNGLAKKTAIWGMIGLGALIIALTPKASHISQNKKRYEIGISKIKKLAEYDNIPGTGSHEWLSVYKKLGLTYEIGNKLTEKQIDMYLEKFGYFWDGERYSNDVDPVENE